jgi:hypothetical protein
MIDRSNRNVANAALDGFVIINLFLLSMKHLLFVCVDCSIEQIHNQPIKYYQHENFLNMNKQN